MKTEQLDAIIDLVGDVIREAVAPLQAKIADLEKQLAQRPDVAALVSVEVGKAVAGLPTPKDGKSITMDDVQPIIKEVTMRIELDAANVRKTVDDALAAVDERMKAIRQPEDGRSVTVEDVRPMLDEAIKQLRQDADEAIAEPLKTVEAARDQLFKALGDLRQPEDGKSVTLVDVQPVLDEALQRMQKDVSAAVERVLSESKSAGESVQKAIEGIRQPEDGKSVTVDDVAPIIKAEVDKAVALIPVPKDGAGVAGAMIDRDGNLNLTLTNGEVKNLGRVEGKDGVDGISLDAFEMEYLPETHEVAIKAVCAGRVKELRYPAGGIRPAGYWRDGSKAKAGDVWTRSGSMWIAKRDTSASPEPKSEDWYLAVQKGRDGESIFKTVREGPEPPIKLKGGEK